MLIKQKEIHVENKKVIYLAGGCFWGMQKFIDQFDGVISTEVGYANGPDRAPTYKEVCMSSGHAETVRVDYDADRIRLEKLLDYENDSIEVGFSIAEPYQGRGYAGEALAEVLKYLTENEEIPQVTAWCAAENIASRRTLEKAGMQFFGLEKEAVKVGDRSYDRLVYVYRKEN